MKILFITQFLPFPPDTGGKIKTFNSIKLLSEKHQVFLISFVEKKEDLFWEKELKKYCYNLKTFVAPIITSSHKKLRLKAFVSFFNSRPFRIQKYFFKEAAEYIFRLTRQEQFDAVHLDHETSIQYLPYIHRWEDKLKIYDEHNISSEGLFGYVKYEKNLLGKVAYLIEGLKFWLYERKSFFIFDYILVISDDDREKLIKRGLNPAKIIFIPVPFKAKMRFRFGSKKILFIGLLSWWPNKDAILWFYNNVFSLIKKRIFQTKLIIAGDNLPRDVRQIAERDPSVEVTGYVKDLTRYYRNAGVFIVPVRAGAGIRIKILDALSFGLPVVSTKVAAKGIKVEDKKNILIAENDMAFANKIIDVLTNKKLATQISSKGLNFIKENYNMKRTRSVLRQVYFRKGK